MDSRLPPWPLKRSYLYKLGIYIFPGAEVAHMLRDTHMPATTHCHYTLDLTTVLVVSTNIWGRNMMAWVSHSIQFIAWWEFSCCIAWRLHMCNKACYAICTINYWPAGRRILALLMIVPYIYIRHRLCPGYASKKLYSVTDTCTCL